jgi:isopenicillin N synthase-like dioxygenase
LPFIVITTYAAVPVDPFARRCTDVRAGWHFVQAGAANAACEGHTFAKKTSRDGARADALRREGAARAENAPTMEQVPLIDLAPLREGTGSGLAQVAHEIGVAARHIGFFAVEHHGVPDELVTQMFAAARAFFALPFDEKQALSIEESPAYLGYARSELERLDPTRPGDVKESFNMGRERDADDPDVRNGTPFVGVNRWPSLPGFRSTMVRYFETLTRVGLDVHRAIAADLGLAPDFFIDKYDRPLTALRVLRYPPHPGEFNGTQYGAGPHTDYGGVTLLAQDGTEGLEVRRRDGMWIAVAPAPGTFVCNIGDAMMRWTNDVYVSNAHRVVNRSGRERYSCAFFCEPNPDALIACIPACESPANPAKYPPIAFADFLRSKVEPAYR